MTVISYADPLQPFVSAVIRDGFAESQDIFQMDDLLFSCELDTEGKLQFITATFNNDVINVVDTVKYSDEVFSHCEVRDVIKQSDSTYLVSLSLLASNKEKVIYVSKKDNELSFT
ncbi:MAG: hypothetical protein GY777_25425, partial [Candidatus Brocadiaceae bacterium]|nr:hypothetical protein [Candidatus Brocadiaceae bacterium]